MTLNHKPNIRIVTDSAELREAAEQFADYITAETLATELQCAPVAGAESVALKLAGHDLQLTVSTI